MVDKSTIQRQLKHTIGSIELPPSEVTQQATKYEGKVRDCWTSGERRILVTTDRLSAFDVVLTTIPFKGQILSQVAKFWFDRTKDIVPNHLISSPHPNVMCTQEVKILPIEVVVRGYLTGSAWRDYQAGKAVSGLVLPKGLTKYSQFAEPLITPSTKAAKGVHDQPISSEEIISSGIIPRDTWERTCQVALELFEFGSRHAAKQGLILVDTKFEFGLLKTGLGGLELVLADEILTQDCSRYWIAKDCPERIASGQDPEMLDKEFIRGWLIDRGYMGEGTPPDFPDDFRVQIAQRYIEAYQILTGKEFVPLIGDQSKEISEAVLSCLYTNRE